MTPALRMTVPSTLQFSVAVIKPGMKRSSWTQGFRRPVISMRAAAPRCRRAPVGSARRSMPRVVTFSPISPAAIAKPLRRNSSKSSTWMRWTCRRLGMVGSRRTRDWCFTVEPKWASPSTPSPATRRMASHGRLRSCGSRYARPRPPPGCRARALSYHSLEVLVLLKDRSGQGRKAPLRQPREYSDDAGVGWSLPLLSRFPFPASRFLAEAKRLSEFRAGFRVARRDHRVIGTKAPFRSVLLRG